MKKPSSKIREEILKLQEALKLAETREAERIGRIALKAGLGDIEIGETDMQAAFETLASRFRHEASKRNSGSSGKAGPAAMAANPSGHTALSPQGQTGEV